MHKPYLMDWIKHIKPLLLLSLLIISYACGHFWCAFSFFALVNPYYRQISKKLVNQIHLFPYFQAAVGPYRYYIFVRSGKYIPEWLHLHGTRGMEIKGD
jgi:hypothetical protein